ncbi:MAG: aryl-sulfate sulfotransferase [Planctomycetota bacterium]
MRIRSLLFLSLALAGCNGSSSTAPVSLRPTASNLTARVNDNNVLSAFVVFDARNVVSARVFAAGGGESTVTPTTVMTDGPQQVLVMGLLPETDYVFRLEVNGATETVVAPDIAYRTPALPDFLKNNLQVRTIGSSTGGYYLTNLITADPTRNYLFAFDDRGRIRWYRLIPGMGASSELLPNGNFLTFMGSSTGFQDDYGYFLELSPAGEEVNRYQAPRPYYTDGHELLFTPASGGGEYTHFFSYDRRVIDTTSIGGQPNTTIAGHQILRYKPDGELEFRWDAWDHFEIADWIEEPAGDRQRPEGDFDHPNSLEIDLDGNYIVSWRNMAEVTKIDSKTGDVIYRFGGRNNQFTILNDPFYDAQGGFAFSGQHSVRVLANGNLLLYDNGLRHNPQQSRAVEYALDVTARTATMVWQFPHIPPLYTPFTGSVQRLANGNTVVGFAFRGAVVEVDPAGALLWEAAIVADNLSVVTYRINHIKSLYER